MEEKGNEDIASSSWGPMDPGLMEAASSGDVGFLKNAITSAKPADYFLSRYTPSTGVRHRYAGNILHIAAWHNQEKFVMEAMSALSEEILCLLMCQQETAAALDNWNPLHVAVSESSISLVELIVNCNNSKLVSERREINGLKPLKPWPDQVFVAQDSQGRTPALMAIGRSVASQSEILTSGSRAELIQGLVDYEGNSPLFLAVFEGLDGVVLNLLECQGPLCCRGPHDLTALHGMAELLSAPKREEIFEKLLKRFPELITAKDKNGQTVLHKWAQSLYGIDKVGLMWLLEYFFDHYSNVAVKLMLETDCNGNNPLHVIRKYYERDEVEVVALADKLMNLYQQCQTPEVETTSEATIISQYDWPREPWLMKNKNGDTPLLLAIRRGLVDLAWCFYQKSPTDFISIGTHQSNSLVLPVCNGCYNLVPAILCKTKSDENFSPLLTFSGDSNILHLQSRNAESIIDGLLKAHPSLINQPDCKGDTPLDKASAGGMTWLVELMLKTDPSSLKSSPSSWIKACQNGHVSVILTFIRFSSNFRAFCHGHRDTPLHHIKLGSYEDYKEFLVIDKLIEKQIKTQDVDGATPLHKAIRRREINLTEALLTEDADRTIKDKDGKSAMDLLAEVCKHNNEWVEMCKRVGINPRLKTTYVQRETDLLEMRGALLVVAGLLATITFTAGFTLPGGFSSETGQALLAKDTAFLVFLLSDAYAMCCSMLVLFCLIWSMLSDSTKSLLLIDRSMVILLQSLYATLLAFMTGVFTVVAHKSLWAAIIVFVMCSLVGISATIRSILFTLLDKMVPSTDTDDSCRNRLLKTLGKVFTPKRNNSQDNEAALSNV